MMWVLVRQLSVLVLLVIWWVESSTIVQRYQSFEPSTVQKYSRLWQQYHASWSHLDVNAHFCDEDYYDTSYPICLKDQLLQDPWLFLGNSSEQCREVQCLRKTAPLGLVATPSDTMDYLPPPAPTTVDNNTICIPSVDEMQYISKESLGLEDGIPPYYLPLTPVRLNILGTVYGQFNDRMETIPDAKIIAWQVDPRKLTPLTNQNKYEYEVDSAAASAASDGNLPNNPYPKGPFTKITGSDSLRDMSCRGLQHTRDNGTYFFRSLMPPSYGPPRHIMFKISAPGFHTLVTRVYFNDDWRLQQLTTLNGLENARTTESPALALNFKVDNGDYLKKKFPGLISQDPRVADLEFATTEENNGLLKGYFRVVHDFVLSPVRPQDEARSGFKDTSMMPVIDINGMWADSLGGMVQIETHGNVFVAREFPHPRNWGTATGYMLGNTIQGVHFYRKSGSSYVANNEELSEAILSTASTISSSSFTTGVIVGSDGFASAPFDPKNPEAVSIRWQGGSGSLSDEDNYNMMWTKQDFLQTKGYRYIKLFITREYSSSSNDNSAARDNDGGQLYLNEIVFYEGLLTDKEMPSSDKKMKTPRYPQPQIVTCSSFIDQDHHCYKVFDGDASSGSTWVTKAVGSRRKVLKEPQWVLLDFGEGRGIKPTAMRIFCDVANAGSTTQRAYGCPMTFSLQVSQDNVRFDTIYKADMYDYSAITEYPAEGKMFNFVFDTIRGRQNGQRCPSCELGPRFTCHLKAYDGQCDSKYCNEDGQCANPPVCPAGRYLTLGYDASYDTQSYTCRYCSAGRYGASAGLTNPYCSGACSAGYYCPEGSSSDKEIPCGGVGHFCPPGSVAPIPAPAGRKTIVDHDAVDGLLTQSATELCAFGHYCINGEEIPCPLGRYGDTRGLMSSKCSGECTSGYYCPVGTESPLLCQPGNFCPDGKITLLCPAGTYGATTGLKYAVCSGDCAPGYYCETGSVSEHSKPCPPGRYGDIYGLRNSSCTGLCRPGYFCPNGTANYEDFPCGGRPVYCPEGSAQPLPVLPGHYSSGGRTDITHPAQSRAELGYYAFEGIRRPCPAGTFGNTTGLGAEDQVVTFSPSMLPTFSPTKNPGAVVDTPTVRPSILPTEVPSAIPTKFPTFIPTMDPSESPTLAAGSPSLDPSLGPTKMPGYYNLNTSIPTAEPTKSYDYVRKLYACTGFCEPGFYCPTNSSRQHPCPAGRYGSAAGLTNPSCTAACPLGQYCPEGSPNPILCPAGTFGSVAGLTDSTCSPTCTKGVNCDPTASLCKAGYYCPTGSISAEQYECGGPDVYCPTGSGAPIKVTPGYYSVLAEDIENANDPGYYYDPYRRPTTRSDQRICEPGYFCSKGVRSPCPPGTYGNRRGLTTVQCSGLCPPGHYCLEGSSIATQHRCPRGRYGSTSGLTKDICTGFCSPGYHCIEASISDKNSQCAVIKQEELSFESWKEIVDNSLVFGEKELVYLNDFPSHVNKFELAYKGFVSYVMNEPNSVYCPKGSGIPLLVLPGYYTIGFNETTRHDQRICPPGTYCERGVRYDCPGGTYGALERLSTPQCSGKCSKGFYCPPGSTSSRAFPCPIGRYGAEEGLSTPACSGPCPHALDCPLGSTTPTPRSTS